MKRNMLIGCVVAAVLIIGLAGFMFLKSGSGSEDSGTEMTGFGGEAAFYKSPGCGCCELHANYLSSKGKFKLNVIDTQDISTVKNKFGIHSALQSCHTTVIGSYFVEGHMPMEAITKLMQEKPDIAGIALPGMPSGSPGMPGSKSGPFVIYAVNKNGSYYEFMRI